MFGWFNSKQREVRQLNKDAATIVEMATETYRTERQREIAVLTRDSIARIVTACDGDERCLQHETDRIKTLHREARNKHDQVALTAHTLVIIYIRASLMGSECEPARAAIDGYVSQWAPQADDEDVLAG